jgi:multisubunit Na+/H+ antiporter MnhG subunit
LTRVRVAALATVGGAGLLVAGVAVIFWPAALILAGLLLLAAGLFGIDVG